jgi:hypothetical protein
VTASQTCRVFFAPNDQRAVGEQGSSCVGVSGQVLLFARGHAGLPHGGAAWFASAFGAGRERGGAVRGVVHPAKSQCRVGILIVMAIRVGMVYRAGDATRHAMVLGIAPIVPTAAITLSMDWPNLRGVVK